MLVTTLQYTHRHTYQMPQQGYNFQTEMSSNLGGHRYLTSFDLNTKFKIPLFADNESKCLCELSI